MNLYLVKCTINLGYDSYDSMVVSAPDEDAAKDITPNGQLISKKDTYNYMSSSWVQDTNNLTCELIGTSISDEYQVILASFNAG